MHHGSPIWQTAVFFAALLFLLWQIWRGWRAGFARGGMQFGAILVSLSLGCLAAKLAAVPFGGLGNLPGFIAGIVVGGALGIFLLVTIWILAAVPFKRTGHQGSGVFRISWGAGGALFGFLIGLTALWGGISIVRSLGALAESRVAASDNPRIVDLVNDPGVIRASKERNIFLFFDNKAVAAAIADPALAEQLKKVDLRAALKFALESPPPSPAPSQTQSPAKRK
ncbi:MAG: hypothetical protein WBL39_21740 [Terrimicrobiaceae bacterium]